MKGSGPEMTGRGSGNSGEYVKSTLSRSGGGVDMLRR